MEQFVGLDVSQEVTHLCVVDSNGKTVWQGQCVSTPEAIADTLKVKAPEVARISLESGALSTWHWHALNAMGLPVVCLDAKHAKAALSMQVNKTDSNDALGIAQIVRTGWYREVGVKSLDSHTVRSKLGARAQLVGMRTSIMNQIRGTLKTFGIVLGKRRGIGKTFDKQVEELTEGGGMLRETLRVLLTVLRNLGEQVLKLDRQAQAYARKNTACRNLMTIPGVGTLTAVAFVTAVDDPTRFDKSKSVGAYFGLTPRRYQSGEVDQNGDISKCGDGLVRTYLFEAAAALLTRVEKWSALKAWGLRLAKRGCMKKAKVAVARKLAVIMHRMWLTGEAFRWSNPEAAAA
jgi:transposase